MVLNFGQPTMSASLEAFDIKSELPLILDNEILLPVPDHDMETAEVKSDVELISYLMCDKCLSTFGVSPTGFCETCSKIKSAAAKRRRQRSHIRRSLKRQEARETREQAKNANDNINRAPDQTEIIPILKQHLPLPELKQIQPLKGPFLKAVETISDVFLVPDDTILLPTTEHSKEMAAGQLISDSLSANFHSMSFKLPARFCESNSTTEIVKSKRNRKNQRQRLQLKRREAMKQAQNVTCNVSEVQGKSEVVPVLKECLVLPELNLDQQTITISLESFDTNSDLSHVVNKVLSLPALYQAAEREVKPTGALISASHCSNSHNMAAVKPCAIPAISLHKKEEVSSNQVICSNVIEVNVDVDWFD